MNQLIIRLYIISVRYYFKLYLLSLRIICSGNFVCDLSLGNFRLYPSIGNFRLDVSLGNFISLGVFRFETFAWELYFGSFVCKLSPGILRLIHSAWDVSQGNFR